MPSAANLVFLYPSHSASPLHSHWDSCTSPVALVIRCSAKRIIHAHTSRSALLDYKFPEETQFVHHCLPSSPPIYTWLEWVVRTWLARYVNRAVFSLQPVSFLWIRALSHRPITLPCTMTRRKMWSQAWNKRPCMDDPTGIMNSRQSQVNTQSKELGDPALSLSPKEGAPKHS